MTQLSFIISHDIQNSGCKTLQNMPQEMYISLPCSKALANRSFARSKSNYNFTYVPLLHTRFESHVICSTDHVV